MPNPNRLFRLTAILLLASCAAGWSWGAEYSPRKRVLVIESFGHPPATAGAVAFRATLERELGEPVDIYHASLDVARFPGPEHEAQVRDYLKSRYQEHKLDLVVSTQAPAERFLSRQREHLFRDTPVVITGIEKRRVPPGSQDPRTTYVAGEIDVPAQVDNILRLLPGTRRIAILQGTSTYDRFWGEEGKRQLAQFAGKVEIEWIEGLSFDDMGTRVAAMPPGTVVFLGLLVLDASGMQIGREEALGRLRAVAKVPIFGYFESYVGKGVVGGNLYPDVAMGIAAARMAIRILRGEAPGSIAPLVIPQTRPIYDWRELQRFGIAEDRLPPGSEIRYRQPTLWQLYRWHIAATIALLILQALLIGALWVQRVWQRRAEAERRRVESELVHTRGELAHITRVSMLGELSSSLAHELTQPLAAIRFNVDVAQRVLHDETPSALQQLREILPDIGQDTQRAADVIQRVRAMARKEGIAAAPLDMAGAMREVILLVKGDAVARNVNVSLEAEPGLPAVLGDRVQLQQVALNLLLNAFDSMKELHVSERTVSVRVAREDARALKVTISDVGHGFAADAADRVFEAFYTTKPNGLGMGLSISRSIIQAHRGRLWAEHNQPRGASFHFSVPVA